MFFFFDEAPEGADKELENLGIVRVKNLRDYCEGKANLKRLENLYHEMGARKEEEDSESDEVVEAINAQGRELQTFRPTFDKDFNRKYLSANIDLLLKRNGLRISDLEGAVDVSAGYVSRTIGEDSKKRLSIDIVWKIAELFKVNIDDLVNGSLDSPTKDLKQGFDVLVVEDGRYQLGLFIVRSTDGNICFSSALDKASFQ